MKVNVLFHVRRLVSLVLLVSFISFAAYPDCNEETKAKVDTLKSSLSYPRLSIGDIAYIAFIKDPNIGTNQLTEKDIIVKKVKIVDMMLYNSVGGPDYTEGVFLESSPKDFPLKWKYQFIDTSINNPKYGDRSDFHDEERFQSSPIEAKRILKDTY